MSWLTSAPIGRREMLRGLAFGAAVAAVPMAIVQRSLAAVAAAADLVIAAGQAIVLQGPLVAQYGTITIETGGSLEIQGNVTLSAEELVKQ